MLVYRVCGGGKDVFYMKWGVACTEHREKECYNITARSSLFFLRRHNSASSYRKLVYIHFHAAAKSFAAKLNGDRIYVGKKEVGIWG